jgi:hypothetical protein
MAAIWIAVFIILLAGFLVGHRKRAQHDDASLQQTFREKNNANRKT